MIHYRGYGSREAYLAHQRGKDAVHSGLIEYSEKLMAALVERYCHCVKYGESMLCLGARIGAEVEAFQKMGLFAVGIDINPGDKNPYVLFGDFSCPIFGNGTIQNIYTNSLDHVFDLEPHLNQIKQQLVPNGHFFLDLVNGTEQGYSPGAFEACWWDHTDDVINLLKERFEIVSREPIEIPWPGESIVMRNHEN